MRIRRTANVCGTSIHHTPIVLPSVDKFKYLGVLIDNRLSFGDHIVDICGCASRTPHLPMRNCKKANPKTRTFAYNALCRPKLEYATQTWSPDLIKNKTMVEKINQRAYRSTTGLGKYDHISNQRIKDDWLTLKGRMLVFDS